MPSDAESDFRSDRRSIAVVGGHGFIGTPLVRALIEQGHRVRVLTRGGGHAQSTVEYVRGDLMRPVAEWGPNLMRGADAVISVAGELRDTKRMPRINGEAPVELLRLAAERDMRCIHVSSVGVYGRVTTGVVDEDRPFRPNGEYEVTKAKADRELLTALKGIRTGGVILRPSNVFGPGMPGVMLHRIAEALASSRFWFVGPPLRVANLVWVDDVINAILCALGPRAPADVAAYNVSDELCWEDVVAELATARGVPVPKRRLPAWPLRLATLPLAGSTRFGYLARAVTTLSNSATYSTAKIRRDLGWVPRVGVRAGLRRLFGNGG